MPNYGYLLPTRGSVLSSPDASTLAAKTEGDIIGLAKRAESAGFRSVWVGDSVLAKPRLEPLSTLAALATATESVDLGTAVYLPPLRHPVNFAHLTATVDQLSGGRLSLGIGVGIGPDVNAEYDNLGIPFDERGARLNELLDITSALWSGSPVDYSGNHYALEEASIGFGPVGAVPLYIASAAFDPTEGFPTPIEQRLIKHGDGWMPIGLTPDQYATALTEIRSMLADAGRNPDAFDPAYYLDVVINENEQTAIDEAREYYDRYYPAWDTLSDEQVRARGSFGPFADVADTVSAYIDAGVETLIVRFTTTNQRVQLRQFTTLL